MDKSLSLTEILGQYLQMTPVSNSHHSGHCPFCSSGDKDNLIVSLISRHWICLTCGADGDRFDFVAKSENISRAEAILLVSRHAESGEPFAHARFKPQAPAPEEKKIPEPEQTPEKAPAPAAPKPTKAKAASAKHSAGSELLARFLQYRDVIPSYQGAAVLDGQAKLIASDSDFPLSSNLTGIGETLTPVLAHVGTLLPKNGASALPATLTFASDDLAIVAHQSGTADKALLLLVQLANPADVPVTRRLVTTASKPPV